MLVLNCFLVNELLVQLVFEQLKPIDYGAALRTLVMEIEGFAIDGNTRMTRRLMMPSRSPAHGLSTGLRSMVSVSPAAFWGVVCCAGAAFPDSKQVHARLSNTRALLIDMSFHTCRG